MKKLIEKFIADCPSTLQIKTNEGVHREKIRKIEIYPGGWAVFWTEQRCIRLDELSDTVTVSDTGHIIRNTEVTAVKPVKAVPIAPKQVKVETVKQKKGREPQPFRGKYHIEIFREYPNCRVQADIFKTVVAFADFLGKPVSLVHTALSSILNGKSVRIGAADGNKYTVNFIDITAPAEQVSL